MSTFRYSQWDGSQEVFDPDHDELMDALADDLMNHGDVNRALRDMMRRGMQMPDGQRMEGLRDMMERLRQQRQQQLERYNLDNTMQDMKKQLDDILETERQGMDKRIQETEEKRGEPGQDEMKDQLTERLRQQVNRNNDTLDNLPESLGGAIKELNDYEFMDPEAAAKFQELMDSLKNQMTNNMVQNMRDSLEGMTPGDMSSMREMLRDMNQMLQTGGEPNFQEFMDKHGQMFGDNPPQSFQELMEHMRQQMAQMDSLMKSMSDEQRQELMDLMESVMDDDTAHEMAKLASLMSQFLPPDNMDQRYPFMGDESLDLQQAMQMMSELQAMDQLEQHLQDVTRKGNFDDLDMDEIERLLGEDARRNLEQLAKISKMLEEAGYIRQNGDKMQLTPRGIRKIAQKALKEVFANLQKDKMTSHDLYQAGMQGDPSGATRQYEFGDPFDLSLEKTLHNAIVRNGPGTPVKIHPDDFELVEREQSTQAATAVLLDQSKSMGHWGSWAAAKKVALALIALVRSQYPRDAIYLIGFSDMAIEIKEDELPETSWNAWVSGTNMQHALMMSRKLLNKHKGATRQIIMITDGEPTAHMEGSYPVFSYPPSFRTMQETLREVRRVTQEGITINTFMLESNYYLLDFIDKLTKINRGRAFYTNPDQLGEYVLVDYINNRRKRVSA
jgi:uncharacterized protein with von Willebrand factor type A (vWA) domain